MLSAWRVVKLLAFGVEGGITAKSTAKAVFLSLLSLFAPSQIPIQAETPRRYEVGREKSFTNQ